MMTTPGTPVFTVDKDLPGGIGISGGGFTIPSTFSGLKKIGVDFLFSVKGRNGMITIDNEFRNIIPALTSEEYAQLEKNIIAEGCRDALVTWQSILIDGHNRYKICREHGIDYETVEMEFTDRQEAIKWIILNQFGRRNLSAYDRSLLALRLKPIIAEKAKEKQVESGGAVPQKSDKPPIETNKEIAKVAGVSHDTIARVEKIEQRATPEIKDNIKAGKISINQAYQQVRRLEKIEAVEEKEPIPLPTDKYNVILADPPWKYDFSETTSRDIENQYPTMNLDDIKQLKAPSTENSVLFLWATAPKLQEALEVMQAWGFEYRTCAVWDKEVIGMGYWFRGQHELLLVGVKGQFSPPEQANRFSSVIRARRQGHSQKPERVYELLETMFPNGKRLEVFARNKREGWEVWGNEV